MNVPSSGVPLWPRIRDFVYAPTEFFGDYAGASYYAQRSGPATKPSVRLPTVDPTHEVEVNTDLPDVRRLMWFAERYGDPAEIAVRTTIIDLVDGVLWTRRERLRAVGLWLEARGEVEIEPRFIDGLLRVRRRTDGRGCWLDEEEVEALIEQLSAKPPST